jgi:predicted Zn-dependent peptidase
LLNKHFGQNDWISKTENSDLKHEINSTFEEKKMVKKPESVQSSIRIGRKLFTKKHPDFFKLFVLNTIFGGYFGSRLMSNIREEKGYTYGIHSVLDSKINEGSLYITTEVGSDVCDAAIAEIYKEMKRLRDEPVEPDELKLVRSYLLGSILAGIDGPFKTAGTVKGMIAFGLEMDYFYQLVATIKTVTPSELQECANKYFQQKDFCEMVVGNRN